MSAMSTQPDVEPVLGLPLGGPAADTARKRAARRAVWEEQPSFVGQFGKGAVLTVVVLAVVLPLYAIILTSVSTEGAITRAGGSLVLVPDGLSFAAYREIFTNGVVTRAVVVSFGVTAVGTA